jgi:hypothetical protein
MAVTELASRRPPTPIATAIESDGWITAELRDAIRTGDMPRILRLLDMLKSHVESIVASV